MHLCRKLLRGYSSPARSENKIVRSEEVRTTERTLNIEDLENPVEFQPPSCDHVLVTPRMNELRKIVVSDSFGRLLLDIRAGHSVIRCIVSGPHKPCTVASTHTVNWLIALHTDCLRSSSCFPFIPRSSAVQIWTRFNPSST